MERYFEYRASFGPTEYPHLLLVRVLFYPSTRVPCKARRPRRAEGPKYLALVLRPSSFVKRKRESFSKGKEMSLTAVSEISSSSCALCVNCPIYRTVFHIRNFRIPPVWGIYIYIYIYPPYRGDTKVANVENCPINRTVYTQCATTTRDFAHCGERHFLSF